jgi:hypothetical protein
MWAQEILIAPSQRRFRTQISLTGETLTQELAGTQTRTVQALGCTFAEYAELLRAAESTAYVENSQFQASAQIHLGINLFQVQGSGQRKLLPGQTDNGSYTYTANC